MNSIDQYVRSLIEKSDADNPEARNQVYLAARKAIQKLPPDKSRVAMEDLFEAVKNIEAEYVRMEMGNHAAAVPPSVSQTAWRKPALEVPWITIAAILAIILVVSFSSYLLFKQFDEPLKTGSGSSQIESGEEEFVSLFKISQFDDFNDMATNPSGTTPPTAYGLGKAENLLKFKSQFALYSKKPIVIDKSSLYLVQLILEYMPAESGLILNTGFSSLKKHPPAVMRSMFLHTGKVKSASYRSEAREYFFSKIVSWDDLKNDLFLHGETAEVRPMIIVRPSTEDTVVVIKSFTVDKLG